MFSLLAFAGGRSWAQSLPIDIENGFSPGSHQRFIKRVSAAQARDYRTVLEAYDARRAAHPEDITSQIERCRFIESFADSEDETVESASDDLTQCREDLNSGRNRDDVDVVLYHVESSWTPEDVAAAKMLVPKSAGWSRAQRATLLELLSQRLQWSDADQSTRYAMQAVELDPGSRVLIPAVRGFIRLGAKDRARRLLIEAPPGTWENVQRVEAAKILIDLGDPKAAGALLRDATNNKDDLETKITLARILAGDGEIAAARELYRGALGAQYVARETRLEYFEFERSHGTAQAAGAAYQQFRDQGFGADPLARYRLGLFFSHPGLAWQGRDLAGLLALLAAVAAFGLVPLIVIVPVHYRGLARKVAGRAPDLAEPAWQLRHAWYAMAALFLSGFAFVYALAPGYLNRMLRLGELGEPVTPVSDHVLARLMLWSTVALLLLLTPLWRGRSVRTLLLGQWSIKKSILVGLGWALLLRLLAGLLIGAGFKLFGLLGSDTTRSIQGMHELYGLTVMLVVVAVLTPLAEEFIFRGALLQAFRGRVSFWFAALVQALAFVLMHEEWQSMPYLFVFALVCAWLARRSQGLLAPVVLHGVNNAIAALGVAGLTQAINH